MGKQQGGRHGGLGVGVRVSILGRRLGHQTGRTEVDSEGYKGLLDQNKTVVKPQCFGTAIGFGDCFK